MGIFSTVKSWVEGKGSQGFSAENGDGKNEPAPEATKPRYSYNHDLDLKSFHEINGIRFQLQQIRNTEKGVGEHTLRTSERQRKADLELQLSRAINAQRIAIRSRMDSFNAEFLENEHIFVLGEGAWTYREQALPDGKTHEARMVLPVKRGDQADLRRDMAAGGPVGDVYGGQKFIEGPVVHTYVDEGTPEQPIIPTATDITYVRFGSDETTFYEKEISTKRVDNDGILHTEVTVVGYMQGPDGKIIEKNRTKHIDNGNGSSVAGVKNSAAAAGAAAEAERQALEAAREKLKLNP